MIENALSKTARLKAMLFTWFVSKGFARVGPRARITPPLRCSGMRGISIGEGAIIHRDCWLQTIGEGTRLEIGNFAGIGMGASLSAARKITVGDHVIFGRNVFVSDHAHAFKDVDRPIALQGIDNVAPISIGAGSWLCQNVVVLPGVEIGRHCVIGANSVVNSSIPDFSVAVGTPARIVKRFSADSRQWERVG